MQNKIPIQKFTDLLAWQEAHKFVLVLYKATESFPSREMFGLTNQMRRAAVSITSNIAEGFGRRTEKEKMRFYDISIGSLNEIRSQLFLSRDLMYLQPEQFDSLDKQLEAAHRLLNGLIRSIASSQLPTTSC